MKTINYLIFVCFVLVGCSNEDDMTLQLYDEFFHDNLECMNMERPSGSYNYPIYPGTKEWAKLNTGEEMLAACQIPTKTLRKMSTQAVIQAIWEHPLLSEICHRSQYQMDFESLFSENNAFLELCTRKDACTSLLDRLVMVNPLTPYPRLSSQVLEILISQPVFLKQFSNTERRTIVEATLKNDDIRQRNLEWNSAARAERHTSFLLISKTLIAAGYSPYIDAVKDNEDLKAYNDAVSYADSRFDSIPQIIISFSNDYLTLQ